MTALAWDKTGERLYETGVDRGVLYRQNAGGIYDTGYAWNGLTAVTESPTGAEATPIYADNRKYLNLMSVEEFGCTIEAYTYPDAFAECDGTATPQAGIAVGQQGRKTFGLAYRTLLGNDIAYTEYGYKLHLVWGGLAAPSEKAYATVNDSPEAISFSWEVTTTAVEVPNLKPTAQMVIDSTKVSAVALKNLEDALYGTAGSDPRLPSPEEVLAFFAGSITEVTPTQPTFDAVTGIITIPTVVGVSYYINGYAVSGSVEIEDRTVVKALPTAGYRFPANVDSDWDYLPD